MKKKKRQFAVVRGEKVYRKTWTLDQAENYLQKIQKSADKEIRKDFRIVPISEMVKSCTNTH